MSWDLVFVALNIVSAAVVVVSCVCRLSAKQFVKYSPFAFAYALLGGSAMVVLALTARGQVPQLSELAANVGMAVYFLARSRSVRRLWRRWFG
ncbi:hypothetical protein QDY71_10225 [Kingella negevensis]|uniref:Holin n=1 Tax=Kingella negevensis TaxID=1522312 RepID=A0A238HI06_9NEIS|nr:hypothetical protein [Kingella negevensis]MDK4680837.1 hypothetical protein [Kingella negevensis]MDK4681440.1 hypothetical protein [Kingella negevensis]MDK4684277.1 hypothetical protein [Kingella negevensis]MDK4691826.1 hypothetical protein [Kingella negevensis]MDK4693020.1 hypothetical protein [Kingella negevensis]